jgi:hypothetical protein
MKTEISLVSAAVSAPNELPTEWKFAFSIGYGHWALETGSRGTCKRMPIIPWMAKISVVIDDNIEFYHDQDAERFLLFEPYEFKKDSHHIGLLVWTRNQWLYITANPNEPERLFCIPWDRPYTFACGYMAIRDSGYYSPGQIAFLENYFDPVEWAGKGDMVDDQSFFDAWVPGQMHVYSGYWRYFMVRLTNRLMEEGLISIKTPSINPKSSIVINHASSRGVEAYLKQESAAFISSELRIGLYKLVPKEFVRQIHVSMPPRIQTWLDRRS